MTSLRCTGERQAGSLEALAALLDEHAFEIDNGLLKEAANTPMLQRAWQLMPGCLSKAELEYLADKELLVCSSSQCDSTCGSFVGYLFFPLFIMFSVVVLLNLVVASLLISYSSILGRKPLSREIIHFKPGPDASITKRMFKSATLQWFQQV
jgi:hypothetical protein